MTASGNTNSESDAAVCAPQRESGAILSAAQVAAWAQQAREASPGPWVVVDDDSIRAGDDDGAQILACCWWGEFADTVFVAAARQAVPDLCASHDRLRAALATAERERDAAVAELDRTRQHFRTRHGIGCAFTEDTVPLPEDFGLEAP